MKLTLLFAAIHITLFSTAQRVGIGTTSPNARLEIVGEGTTNSTNALLVKNSINDTLFRIRNDGKIALGYSGPGMGRTLQLGGNGINFYKDDTTYGGTILPTDTSLIIWSDDHGTKYVILQPSWGRVGIGTYSPKAKLHVRGDFQLGEDGSILNHIIKVSILRNLPAIAPGTSVVELFTITGATFGSSVMISPGIALTDGLIIAYARVSAADTVEVKFINTSIASINLAGTTFHITVVN